MKYKEIEPLISRGKIGMLPNYKGYFKWNYGLLKIYFLNGDYIKYDLDEEKKRNDWYYII